MTVIVCLIIAALVMIFFEVLLPGGILGVLAGLCILLATWIGFSSYGLMGGMGVLITAVVLSGLLLIIEFKYLARSKSGNGLFLRASIDGSSHSDELDESVIGKEGTALTRLNPNGRVSIDGTYYEAYSPEGFIESGEAITVTSKDTSRLIIKKL